MSARKLMLIALATAGALSTTLVQARDVDVQWSVTIGGGLPVPRPVYLPVPTVYVPAPPPVVMVPVPQRVYVPVIEQPYPVYSYPVSRRTHWDVDGDGIPNRYDRVYNPHWDRDGDGIPNRYDRYDDRRDRWHHGGHHGSQGRGHARGQEGGERGYSGGHDAWRHKRQIRSVSR